jgi:arylsulfatase A-like enzyme
MRRDRPNVLWISLEDTSPRFGCYGDPVARTPNLDRLAAEGCRFPNAFSTAGVCAPSRSAIITGMYQTAIGTHHMRTTHTNPATPGLPTPYWAVIPHYVKCFPEYMRAAGYFCTNNFKTDYQFAPPLTAWDACCKGAHWRERPGDQPFFAVFNLDVTHESGMWTDRGAPMTDPDSMKLPPYLPDTPECRQALARQYDHIAENDAHAGDLLRELEQDGLADNTIVFIWSDHGEGLPRAKRWLYDGGLRVPLIVRWPGHIAPGSVDERLVSMVDLGPTVLSLTRIPIPWHMQGQPFIGPPAAERQYIYAARDRCDESYDMVRGVRDRRYKYLRNYRPDMPRLPWVPYANRHPVMREIWRRYLADELKGSQRWFAETTRPVEELYDIATDPHELTNLAADPAHRDVLERMRGALDEWRSAVGDMGVYDELQMKHYWYPGESQPRTEPVVFVPLTPDADGVETRAGGRLQSPAAIQLHSATQGASVAYGVGEPEGGRWLLYTGPIRLGEGVTKIRAKAVRIGYAESSETEAIFDSRGYGGAG